MFNLKRKVQNIVRQNSMSDEALIAEIHHQFENAGDKLLAEATGIIAGINLGDEEKVLMLKKHGFGETKEVSDYDKAKNKKDTHESLARAIYELNMAYPMYKFITPDEATHICEKYHLVIGDVSQYKGVVPKKNLLQIDAFFQIENEINTRYVLNYSTNGKLTYSTKQAYEQQRSGIDESPYQRFMMGQMRGPVMTIKQRAAIKIAAPLKDMQRSGYKLKGVFLERIIPDPVVMSEFSYNGVVLYCIITAWGAEASDEMVVNQKAN